MEFLQKSIEDKLHNLTKRESNLFDQELLTLFYSSKTLFEIFFLSKISDIHNYFL